MLKGMRPLILIFDVKTIFRKICKTWNSITRNILLSVKVDNLMLFNITFDKLHYKVLVECFWCEYNYKIIIFQKTIERHRLG